MSPARSPSGLVKLEESYTNRLREVYRLEKGPRTLEELAQPWNRSFQSAFQTEKGKQFLDRLVRGELVYGETRTETRHVVRLGGERTVHVNCAIDALIEGFFLDVEIQSSCPHCEDNIALKMVGRQVVSARPRSTVLWLGISPHGEGPTTEVLCPFINFFASQDHEEKWREENPLQPGVLMDLSQAQTLLPKP